MCGANRCFVSLAPVATQPALQNPTYSTQHSLFSTADKKYPSGAIVAAPSFDAELHIETTTIMFADVVESVRLIEQDELTNVTRIRTLLKRLAEGVVPKHSGLVLERRGDGLLVRFPNARLAAASAHEMHSVATRESVGRVQGEVVALRIGVHSADVLSDAGALYGKNLNVTARIAGLAKPGQTVISAASCDQLTPALDGSVTDLGDCFLKHLEAPLRLYSLRDKNGMDAQLLQPDQRDLRPKVAVLPFDAELTHLDAIVAAETLSEEISLALARVSELTVISRLTMAAFRRRVVSVAELRESIGADYVISGRLVLLGDRFRASVELCQVSTDAVVWSDRVVDKVSDLLSGASDAVGAVCGAVGVSVLAAEINRTQSQPMPTLSSQSLLTGAISLMHRSSYGSYQRAESLLSALIDRHARHPLPYAWSAKQHLLRSWRGWSSDLNDDASRARELAERALQANPMSSLALAVRGLVFSHIDRDFGAAAKCYEAAIAESPNESLTWIFKSTMHSFMGDGDLALQSAERALTLSPLDPLIYYYKSLAASAALTAGDLQRAIQLAVASKQLNRLHLSNYRVLAIAFALQGDLENGTPAVQELLELDPDFNVRKFLAKSPGAASAAGARFAEALRFVGVPN